MDWWNIEKINMLHCHWSLKWLAFLLLFIVDPANLFSSQDCTGDLESRYYYNTSLYCNIFLVCNHVGHPNKVMPGSYNRRGLRQPKIFAPASARGPRRGPLAVAPAKIFGWLKHPNHHYPKIQTCNQIWLQTDKLMGGTTFPITDWPWDSVKIYLFSNNYPFLAHLPGRPAGLYTFHHILYIFY